VEGELEAEVVVEVEVEVEVEAEAEGMGRPGQRRHRRARRDGGVAAVELALVLPLVLLLVLGMIDYGWYFFVDLAATNAAREGARVATTWPGACPNSDAIAAGAAAVSASMDRIGLAGKTQVSASCGAAPGGTDPQFRFDVRVDFPRLTGFPLVPMPSSGGGFPGDHVVARASASMRGVQ